MKNKNYLLLALLWLMSSVSILAQSTATLSIPDVVSGTETANVPIIIESISGGTVLFDLEVQFDSDHATFEEIVYTNPMFIEASCVFNVGEGAFHLNWTDPAFIPAFPQNGDTICIVKFSGDGVESDLIWDVGSTEMANEDFESYNLNLLNGSVVVNSTDSSEDFETGDFSKFEWQFDGDADWTIDGSTYYEGAYSARSGVIADDQTSELYINMDVEEEGHISFYVNTSTETNYDKLTFFIDEVEQGNWSGIQGWQQAIFNVSAGNHTFKWVYSKDYGLINGEDAVWIDNIVFPDSDTPSALLVVENLIATVSGGSLLLDWDYPGFNAGNPPPPVLLSYKVYKDGVLIANVTESTYTMDFFGGEYCVTAVYVQGESEAECVDSIGPPAFASPENLNSLVQNENDVFLDWDYPGFNAGNPPPPGLQGYNLARDGEVFYFTTATDFTEEDIEVGEHEYCVKAVYMTGESDEVCTSFTIYEGAVSGMEDFETGGFTSFDWQFGGDSDWVIDTNNPFAGTYSARSGAIEDNQNTDLIISINVLESGEISFVKKTSCENGFDKLFFYIDDEEMAFWAGENDWSEASFAVESGIHTFKWSYVKDINMVGGEDAVWLDNIIFPVFTNSQYPIPINLSALVQNGTDVVLSWEAPEFATSYKVYKMNDAMEYVLLGETIDLTYLDSSLETGETYFYGVTAMYEFMPPIPVESDFAYVNIFVPSSGESTEDFETGDFSKFDWQFNGTVEWIMETENAFAGLYSAKTAAIQDKDTTQLVISLDLAEAGDISFYKKTSTENGWDYFRFFIDDELMGQWSGEEEWSLEYYSVEAGFHTFKWSYEKDWFAIGGQDCVWLDNITLPGIAGQAYLAPENLISSVDGNTVLLDWDYPGFDAGNPPPPGLQGYNLARDNEVFYFTTATEFTEDDVPAGEHQYCVKAVYMDGESDPVCTDFEIGVSYFNLGGTILADGSSIDEGFAYLYKIEDGQIVDVFANFISEYGYYDFPQLEAGEYILKAELSPNSPLYNQYIPTYYGDVPNWTNATLINLQANTWNADVNMIPIGYGGTGSGLISGYLKKTGKGLTSFVSNIEIILLNEDNSVLDVTYTNGSGMFEFDNIDYGSYKVLVEITGLHSDVAEIVLSEENPEYDDLTFVVNAEGITLTVRELPLSIATIGDVFPNPVHNTASISYTMNESSQVQWELYDVSGNRIFTSAINASVGQNQFEFNTFSLEAGVYFIQIKIGAEYSITKKVVKF